MELIRIGEGFQLSINQKRKHSAFTFLASDWLKFETLTPIDDVLKILEGLDVLKIKLCSRKNEVDHHHISSGTK